MIQLRETSYLKLMMVLAPLINFLSGIAIDLYTPSMPEIMQQFHTTTTAVQNTITVFVIGWAIGCLVWGAVLDLFGRKKIILSALGVFVLLSLIATQCHTISQLMLIRFTQGFMTAAMSVGSRAVITDHFTGHKYVVAIIYASFTYGFGLVIAPFIGGYLQYHFGWQASFYAFAFCGSFLLLLIWIFVQERVKRIIDYRLKDMLTSYKTILTHRVFISGCTIIGLAQFELLLYSTIGAFMVERQLHYSPIVYGNSAVIVGAGYLIGSIINRILLNSFRQKALLKFGFLIMLIAVLLQIIFAMYSSLSLLALIIPITLICFANGFIVGNIASMALGLFQKNAAVSTAVQICMSMAIGSFGVFIISFMNVSSLLSVMFACLVTMAIQIAVYKYIFITIFD